MVVEMSFVCMWMQTAFQTGLNDVAKMAAAILWNHFVRAPAPPGGDSYVTTNEKDFKLTSYW